MSSARHPQQIGSRASAARWRRRDFGGFSTAFLTLSVLLLVMALGFVFGRVVIARAYIKAAPAVGKSAPPSPAATTQIGNTPQVVYGQGNPMAAAPAAPRQMNPSDVPSADTSGASDSTAGTSTDESAAPTASDASSADPGDVRYAVQVGLFSSEQSARQAADQLTLAGYPARIEPVRDSSQTNYRVLTGRYRSESNARKALDQIKHEGFSGAFVVGR